MIFLKLGRHSKTNGFKQTYGPTEFMIFNGHLPPLCQFGKTLKGPYITMGGGEAYRDVPHPFQPK